jgi:hypothetical protein
VGLLVGEVGNIGAFEVSDVVCLLFPVLSGVRTGFLLEGCLGEVA